MSTPPTPPPGSSDSEPAAANNSNSGSRGSGSGSGMRHGPPVPPQLELQQIRTHDDATHGTDANTDADVPHVRIHVLSPEVQMLEGEEEEASDDGEARGESHSHWPPLSSSSPPTPSADFDPHALASLSLGRPPTFQAQSQAPIRSCEWSNLHLFAPGPAGAGHGGASGGSPGGARSKQLLHAVSGAVYPGELLAIMGPSGSGKTTLLKLLGGGWKKAAQERRLEGQLLINGSKPTKSLRRVTAYVEQEDVLLTNLTVLQTLTATALLRRSRHVSKAEQLASLQRILQTLDLLPCQHTSVAVLSGGQRRRLNVAIELLSEPSLLLCDEPTSGLDSVNCDKLVRTLRSLADTGRAVVCSIHQPSTPIFELFDKLLLLAAGRVVYYGRVAQLTAYLAAVERPCRPHWNPADYVMELAMEMASHMQEQQQQHKDKDKHKHKPALRAPTAEEPRPAVAAATPDPSVNLSSSAMQVGDARATSDSAQSVATPTVATATGHARTPTSTTRCGSPTSAASPPLAGLHPLFHISAQVLPIVRRLEQEQQASLRQQQPQQQKKKKSGVNPAESAPRLEAVLSAPSAVAVLQVDGESEDDEEEEEEAEQLGGSKKAGSLSPSQALLATAPQPISWLEEFHILLVRCFQQKKGEVLTAPAFTRIMAAAVIAGLVWLQLPHTVAHAQDRFGALFFVLSFWFMSAMMGATTVFPAERRVVQREQRTLSYRLSAYFCAKSLSELPVQLLYPSFFVFAYYWMIGFEASLNFLVFLSTVLLLVCCGDGLGLLISNLISDVSASIVTCNIATIVLLMLAGFYAKINEMPEWIRWASYLVFPRYCFSLVAQRELSGVVFRCERAEGDSGALDGGDGASSASASASVSSACTADLTGDQLLRDTGLDDVAPWLCAVIVLGMTVAFRLMAYCSLKRMIKTAA